MATARMSFAFLGTQTLALGAGGYSGNPQGLTTTEEFTGAFLSAKKITTS
jgi:hypothetical protein